jgi:4-hydroxymandelate oxidase
MVDDLSQRPAPMAPLTVIPHDIGCLADYERRAEAHLPPAIWRHVQDGCGSDRALRDNRTAFDRWRLVPSVLADLHGASSAIELFGRRHAAPILAGPLAYQRLAHPDGEIAAVQAAAALEAGFVLSTLSSVRLEDVARASRGAARELGSAEAPLWFQLYLQPARADSLALVRRAEEAGYEAIVLTIDAGVKRAEFALPPGVEAVNLAGMAKPRQQSVPGGRILLGTPLTDAVPRWSDVEWLRSVTALPILLKGLVHGDDLDRALACGADGIVLSNHGGRVFDGFPPALDLLPQVVDRVAGRVPVLVDGGVRSGTDVATAIALGASAVLLGRPVMHALAVAGMAGAAHMFHIIRAEFELAMAQLGCASVAQLNRDRIIAH